MFHFMRIHGNDDTDYLNYDKTIHDQKLGYTRPLTGSHTIEIMEHTSIYANSSFFLV
jgi:hypothetical protein